MTLRKIKVSHTFNQCGRWDLFSSFLHGQNEVKWIGEYVFLIVAAGKKTI